MSLEIAALEVLKKHMSYTDDDELLDGTHVTVTAVCDLTKVDLVDIFKTFLEDCVGNMSGRLTHFSALKITAKQFGLGDKASRNNPDIFKVEIEFVIGKPCQQGQTRRQHTRQNFVLTDKIHVTDKTGKVVIQN